MFLLKQSICRNILEMSLLEENQSFCYLRIVLFLPLMLAVANYTKILSDYSDNMHEHIGSNSVR